MKYGHIYKWTHSASFTRNTTKSSGYPPMRLLGGSYRGSFFFIMLPFMARTYGKIRGASLNYGFSWVSMIAIILGLEFGMG